MLSEEKVSAGLVRTLLKKLQENIEGMEKANIAEYVQLYKNPFRLLLLNFLSGISRGFGIAVGATLVGALFLALLAYLAKLNLPLIGNYVADITQIVRHKVY